jgi:hypothetical protein
LTTLQAEPTNEWRLLADAEWAGGVMRDSLVHGACAGEPLW